MQKVVLLLLQDNQLIPANGGLYDSHSEALSSANSEGTYLTVFATVLEKEDTSPVAEITKYTHHPEDNSTDSRINSLLKEMGDAGELDTVATAMAQLVLEGKKKMDEIPVQIRQLVAEKAIALINQKAQANANNNATEDHHQG